MKLVADPATERWLIGLTGADHEFEWDIGNLTVHTERRGLALGEDAAGRRLALVFTRRGDRLRSISCRAMRPKERALYEEARHQED